jgi:hypothetical protein
VVFEVADEAAYVRTKNNRRTEQIVLTLSQQD